MSIANEIKRALFPTQPGSIRTTPSPITTSGSPISLLPTHQTLR